MKKYVLILLFTTACGISTPQGYVLGTTGYLATYNAGQRGRAPEKVLESIGQEERRELSSLITRR